MAPGEVVRSAGDAQGRRRLRPRAPAGRLRGHARHHHAGLAAADPGARGPLPDRRRASATGAGDRGDRARLGVRRGAGGDRVPRRRDARRRRRGHADAAARGAGFAVLVEADGRARRRGARARSLDALREGAIGASRRATRATPTRSGAGARASRTRSTPCAAASCPRTSPCRSTGWRRRSARACEIGARHGLEAVQLGSRRRRQPAHQLPASTRRRARRGAAAEARRRGAVRDGASSWAARSPASTAWGGSRRAPATQQWPARAVELHGAVKAAFDPKGLLNPGAKRP